MILSMIGKKQVRNRSRFGRGASIFLCQILVTLIGWIRWTDRDCYDSICCIMIDHRTTSNLWSYIQLILLSYANNKKKRKTAILSSFRFCRFFCLIFLLEASASCCLFLTIDKILWLFRYSLVLTQSITKSWYENNFYTY